MPKQQSRVALQLFQFTCYNAEQAPRNSAFGEREETLHKEMKRTAQTDTAAGLEGKKWNNED